VRPGEKKNRDSDCRDHNQERVDAAVQRGGVGVGFWGHRIEREFWGSGEVFIETIENWQDNSFKTVIIFLLYVLRSAMSPS
jgi:hypothetical protein